MEVFQKVLQMNVNVNVQLASKEQTVRYNLLVKLVKNTVKTRLQRF